tara:strand:+ start:1645 stop:2652 length:1008 start_codon:yes stop_codon:yes gene_type:complete
MRSRILKFVAIGAIIIITILVVILATGNKIMYNKSCLNDFGSCYGQGLCNTETGVCACEMGFSGKLCENPYMYCKQNSTSPCDCPNDYYKSHNIKNPNYITNNVPLCKDLKPEMGDGYKPSLIPQPAHIIVVRHADRYYCDLEPKDKTICAAEVKPTDPDKQNTNCLSNKGIRRAWMIGQWINCYAKQNNLKVSVVATQCGDDMTNARPNSTATIIAQSLKAQKNPDNFCSMTFNKRNKNSLSFALSDARFKGTLAVITWDHGAIPHLLSVLGSKNNVKKSEGGCYDLAYDLDTSTGQTYIHKMGTVDENDPCSTECSDGKHLDGCNAYSLEKQI